jgi:hypothetical protein
MTPEHLSQQALVPTVAPTAAVVAETPATAAVLTSSIDGFSLNHFGLHGRLASLGTKCGDYFGIWRARYFVLAEDSNFLVYYLSAAESTPRGVLSLVGASVGVTHEQEDRGIKLRSLHGISVRKHTHSAPLYACIGRADRNCGWARGGRCTSHCRRRRTGTRG